MSPRLTSRMAGVDKRSEQPWRSAAPADGILLGTQRREAAAMSIYEVDKICYRVQHDPAFRERMRADPACAIADAELTAEERAALLAGDVARLHQLGAHDYLLGHLQRYQLLGLTRESYQERMKALLGSQR